MFFITFNIFRKLLMCFLVGLQCCVIISCMLKKRHCHICEVIPKLMPVFSFSCFRSFDRTKKRRPNDVVNNSHHFFCSSLPLSAATPPHLVWQRQTKHQLNRSSAVLVTQTIQNLHLVYLLNQCSSFKILNGFLKVLLLKVVRSQPCNHTDVAGEVPERLDRSRLKLKQRQD